MLFAVGGKLGNLQLNHLKILMTINEIKQYFFFFGDNYIMFLILHVEAILSKLLNSVYGKVSIKI